MRCASPPERVGAARFQLQVAEADVAEEGGAAVEFGQQIARNVALAAEQA